MAQSNGDGAQTETVTVTGSRIMRDGFQTPTPVTAVSQEDLLARAPSNIPDALNQLPQFDGSTSNSRNITWNASTAYQGNFLDLRGMGTTRSLILMDGVRVPSTAFSGGVDINTMPQALVQRVDIVTGGTSAAYGSDAVVGVVNFILDKKFTGFKASTQGGISAYGDDPSYKVTTVGGTDFAGGRGHIEGSFDHYWSGGIPDAYTRPNGASQYTVIGARSAAQPGVTYQNARFLLTSGGGTITSGPLAYYQFQPDGTVQPEDRGQPTVVPATYGVGGSGGYYKHVALASRLQTDQAFGRVSYDLSDSVTAHLQMSAAQAVNTFDMNYNSYTAGGPTGITIFSDNPFLQPSVVAALGGTTSFAMGRIGMDLPQVIARNTTNTFNVNTGLEGTLELFGRNDWHWDANLVYGQSFFSNHTNEDNNRRFYAAIDAARDATGKIVCRVTLTNPSLLPGCVPMDIFGAGAPSQAAINYVQTDQHYTAKNSTGLFTANVSGTLLDLPAGPLAVALGAEARRQTLSEVSNSDPVLAPSVDYTGIRGVPTGVLINTQTNVGQAHGAVNVREGYTEVDAPLLKDVPLAKLVEVNGAARYTDYSTSGSVMTWKVGTNWTPIDPIRFRATMSRDIAAPSLYQLFAGTQVQNITSADPHTNTTSQWVEQTGGNPNLKPEKATTIVAGAVYTPEWLPGFTASADYWHLKIKNAIGTADRNSELNDCEVSNGTSALCAFIIRPLPFSDRSPANFPTRVILTAQNQAAVIAEGVDFEAAYHFSLSDIVSDWGGDMELHSYVTLNTANTTQATPTSAFISQNGASIVQDGRYVAYPKVKTSLEATYTNGPLAVRVGERSTGFTKRSNILVFANYQTEPDVWYTDLDVSYKVNEIGLMSWLGGNDTEKQFFLSIQNLFNRTAPLVADCCNPGLQYPTDRGKYDVVGAYYTVGLRVLLP
jgi:outer membrane receptor protein involved in Fe transport